MSDKPAFPIARLTPSIDPQGFVAEECPMHKYEPHKLYFDGDKLQCPKCGRIPKQTSQEINYLRISFMYYGDD